MSSMSSDVGAGARKGVATAVDQVEFWDTAGEIELITAPAVGAMRVAAVGVAGAAVGGRGVVGGSWARRVALAAIMRWKMTGIWAPGCVQ